MSSFNATGPSRPPSPAVAFVNGFGLTRGNREVLLLLEALDVPNQHAVLPIARSILWLLDDVPWLAEHLGSRLDLEELRAALASLTIDDSGEMPETHGETSTFWATLAITRTYETDLAGLPPLAAVLLLGTIDLAGRDRGEVLPIKTLQELARTIRAICDQGPEHPHRGILLDAMGAPDLVGFATRLAAALKAEAPAFRSDFHRAWVDQIAPWILGQPRKSAITHSEPLPEESAPTSEHASSAGSDRRRPNDDHEEPRTQLDILAPIDPIRGPEPLDEGAPTIRYISPVTSRSARKSVRPDIDRGFAWQRIRSSNQFLQPAHIATLSRAEAELIAPLVIAEWKRALTADEELPSVAACNYVVSLCLGLTLDRTHKIPLVRADHPRASSGPIEILPQVGLVRISVLRPDDAFAPDPQNASLQALLEKTSDHLTLELPPSVGDLLRQHSAFFGVNTLGGVHSPDIVSGAIRNMLEKISELPAISRSIGRARRYLASHLFQMSTDLAMTMIICSDTFGMATSPLFYYSLLENDARQVYRSTVWRLFGDAPTPTDAPTGGRVGSRGLVSMNVLQRGLRQINRHLDFKGVPGSQSNPETIAEQHNHLLNAVLFYLCLISLVRPTDALFELGRFDLDLHRLMGVVWDKKVDAAHCFRLVLFTEGLARQLMALLSHLEAIRDDDTLPAAFRSYAADAVAGRASLFRFAEDGGASMVGSIARWRSMWPSAWEPLSHNLENFFRHAGATYLRECGVPGWMVSLQLGHLEAAGWPFNASSAIRLTKTAKAFDEKARRYEQMLGLRCRLGRGSGDPAPLMRPLRAWDDEIDSAERRRREVEKERALQVQTKMSSVQSAAAAFASSLLASRFPSLAAVIGPGAASASPSAVAPIRFTVRDALELADLIETSEQKTAVRVAAHNLICNWIRDYAKDHKVRVADLGLIHNAPPPEATPLFPGMMEAMEQVRRLRERLTRRKGRAPLSNLVRTVITLVTIGRIQDEETLVSILQNADKSGLVCAGDLHLVTPCRPTDHPEDTSEVLAGFRGAAAIALAGFSKSTSNETRVTAEVVSAALVTEVDEFFGSAAPKDALRLLLRTAQVANILELPGIARTAISSRGAVSAPASLQLALLNQQSFPDPCVGASNGHDDPTPESEASAHEVDRDVEVFRKDLSRALNQTDPSTQRKGNKVGSIEMTLDDMRLNLEALRKTLPERHPCVASTLVSWALHMVDHGTPLRRDPAPSTIATYVMAIAEDLLTLFEWEDLHAVDPDEFGDRYLALIEARSAEISIARTAAQLIHFHRFAEQEHGLEHADLADLAAFTLVKERRVRADACAPAEMAAARAWLKCTLTAESGIRFRGMRDRRRWLIALQVLQLLDATGLRLREACLLTHADIALCGQSVILFVRRSYYRRLKTRAARRVLDLTGLMDAEEIDDFRRWVEIERLRLGSKLRPRSLLFPSLSDPREATSPSAIRVLIGTAFVRAGCRSIHPHLLRHSWVHRNLVRAMGSYDVLADSSGWTLHRALQATAIQIGHVSIQTTVCCYFHSPWLLPADDPGGGFSEDRHALSELSGLALRNVDQIRQRNVPRRIAKLLPAGRTTWSDGVLARISSTLACQNTKLSCDDALPMVDGGLLVQDLDQIFRNAQTEDEFQGLCRVFGLTRSESEAIGTAVTAVADECSIRYLPRATRLDPSARTPAPRRLTDHEEWALLCKLDDLEETEADALAAIALRTLRAAEAQRRNAFVGSRIELGLLSQYLVTLGMPGLRIDNAATTRAPMLCRGSIGQMSGDASETRGISGFDLIAWGLGLLSVKHCAVKAA